MLGPFWMGNLMSKRRVTIFWQRLYGKKPAFLCSEKEEKCHNINVLQQMPDRTPFAIDEVFPTMLGDRTMAETEDRTSHASYYLQRNPLTYTSIMLRSLFSASTWMQVRDVNGMTRI